MSKTREALLVAEKAISDCLTYKSHLGHKALDQVRAALAAPDESAELREALRETVDAVDKYIAAHANPPVDHHGDQEYMAALNRCGDANVNLVQALTKARTLTKSGGE